MPIMPGAIWRPVDSHSGPMQAHLGLVLHVQVGDGSCYGEFAVPANQASSTWWVSKTGTLEQYVDSDMAAWTEAAGNFTWDSVETEGTPDQPLTGAQIATLAKLYAWGVQTYGWPYALTDDVNGRGFIWHGAGGVSWGNHPSCPGDLRKAQRQRILDIAHGGPTPAPPTDLNFLQELLAMTDNGALVRMAYILVLRRRVDGPGYTAWVNYLNGGGTVDAFIATLGDCPEGVAALNAARKSDGLSGPA